MDLALFGVVDVPGGTTSSIAIPGGVGFLVSGDTSQEFKGLNEFAAEDLPPIQFTFQTYHLMILIFGLLLILSAGLWWMNRKGKLEDKPWLLSILVWGWVLPELAIQLGWATAEVGRQPWIVWEELRTLDAISKSVPAWNVALTLAIFAVIYTILFIGWVRVVRGIIQKGPVLPAVSATDSDKA